MASGFAMSTMYDFIATSGVQALARRKGDRPHYPTRY